MILDRQFGSKRLIIHSETPAGSVISNWYIKAPFLTMILVSYLVHGMTILSYSSDVGLLK